MFSTFLKRLFTKAALLAMALSLLAPYAPLAQAQAARSGTLRVTLNNPDAGFDVYNANTLTPVVATAPESGETIFPGQAIERSIPQGIYDVHFVELPGFDFPPTLASGTPYSMDSEGVVQNVMIATGSSVSLNVNYEPEDAGLSGTLRVTLNNPDAGFDVYNANTLTSVVATAPESGETIFPGQAIERSIPQGIYDVHFVELPGFDFPPVLVNDDVYQMDEDGVVQNVSITDGGLAILIVNYETEGAGLSGTLRVTMNNPEGFFTVRNANTFFPIVAEAPEEGEVILPGEPLERSLPQGVYDISFGSLPGFGFPRLINAPPGATFSDAGLVENVMITNGGVVHIIVEYERLGESLSGTLRVTMNHPDGSFEVFNANTTTPVVAQAPEAGETVLPSEPLERNLPQGVYDVDFGDVEGFNTPATEQVMITNGGLVEVFGNYTQVPQTGSIQVRVTNQDGEEIDDGSWEIKRCTGIFITTCTGDFSNGTSGVLMTDVRTGRYGITFELTPNYESAVLLSENPQGMDVGETILFELRYNEVGSLDGGVARINISTVGSYGPVNPGGTIAVNGGITLVTYEPGGEEILSPRGDAPLTVFVDVLDRNTIRFNDNVPNFTPSGDVTYEAGDLVGGEIVNLLGRYRTELTEVRAVARTSDGGWISAPITIGNATDSTTLVTTGVADDYVGRNVNVVETTGNQVTCYEVDGYRFVGSDVFDIAATPGVIQNFTCTYEALRTTTIEVTARLVDAEPGEYVENDVFLFRGIFPGGEIIGLRETDADGTPVIFTDIDIESPYFLVFEDEAGYITPRTPGNTVYVLPLGSLEEGVPEAVDGVYTLTEATIEVRVTGLDADIVESVDVILHLGPDVAGPVVGTETLADGGTAVFGVDPNDAALYTVECPAVSPSGRVILGSPTATFLVNESRAYIYTCRYAEAVAYIFVQTSPIPATVRFDDLLAPSTASGLTDDDILAWAGVFGLYETVVPFRLPLVAGDENFRVTYNVAPGLPGTDQAYLAPAPDSETIVTDLSPGAGRIVGPGLYRETPERETLNIRTLGADDGAIFVDGVPVRESGDATPVSVPISTAETHTVSFEDRAGFLTPNDIIIWAGNQIERQDETRFILGYYVEPDNRHDFFINSRNTRGEVSIEVDGDPNLYFIGIGPLIPGEPSLPYRVNPDNRHEIHFEDKSDETPAYVLRQESFEFGEDTLVADGGAVPTLVIGHYILAGNAAYFQAGVLNPDSGFFQPVTLAIDFAVLPDESFEIPMLAGLNYTDIFVVDVVNDENILSFRNPITLLGEDFTPVPPSFNLNAADYPGGQPEGFLGTLDNPYNLFTTYVSLADTADIEVRVTGNVEAVDVTLESPGLPDTVLGPIDDGESALFEDLDITRDYTIRCSADPFGLTETPPAIPIPAGSLLAGVNTFDCVYVPIATSARITIRTTATDDIDLAAPITLNADGVDRFLGFTVPLVPDAEPASLEVLVDTTVINIINFGDVLGYSTPFPRVVDAPAGSTDRIYIGNYVPLADAARVTINTRLSDTGALTDAPDDNIFFDGEPVGKDTYSIVVDIDDVSIPVSFADNIPLYVPPLPFTLDSSILPTPGVYTFDRFYVPEGREAYIEVNTINAEGEIFVNGESIGVSVAEAFRGPVLLDIGRLDGNVISFGPVAGFVAQVPIEIPQNQPGLSTNVADPTEYSGVYVPVGSAAEIDVYTVQSNGDPLDVRPEIRLDDRIIGYGFVEFFPVTAGAHTLVFERVDGFVTPRDIPFDIDAGEREILVGVYIPLDNEFETITIRTQDDEIPANRLEADIRFSIDDGDWIFLLGQGEVTVNVDETVDSNIVIYDTRFTDPVTAETYNLVTPADGIQELTAPYASLYLGVYHLPGVATADISTMDEANDFLSGVPDAPILVNGALEGTQRIPTFEFEAGVETTVSWGDHPADPTYNTPLPIFFTPVDGRDYPPLVGVYTHTCRININMRDADGDPVAGEVLMSIDGGPDFFFGTGAPGTGVVSINIDENRSHVITVNPPVPNPLGLVPTPATITIPADTYDPLAGDCPVDFDVLFAGGGGATDAFVTITTVDDLGNDVVGEISLNGVVVGDDITALPVDVTVENVFTFGDVLPGFVPPLPIMLPVGRLAASVFYTFPAVYITAGEEATLDIHTTYDGADLNLGAEIGLVTNGAPAVFQGFDDVMVLVNRTDTHSVLWGPVTDYNVPLPNPTPVTPALELREVRPMIGDYEGCPGCPEITVRAINTEDDSVLTLARFTIDDLTDGGRAESTGELLRLYPEGNELLITFDPVPGFDPPVLGFVNPVTVDADPASNVFEAFYTPTPGETVLIFDAEDNEGNSLNATAQVSIDGGAPLGLPLTRVITGVELTFAYTNLPGLVTPSPGAIDDDGDLTVPAGMQVTEDDGAGTLVTHDPGETLRLLPSPFRYTLTGIYTPEFRITKTADRETLNNLEVVRYTLRVDRLTPVPEVIMVTIQDSVTGALEGRVTGDNGGALTYIPGTTVFGGADCSLGSADIQAGAVVCALDGADSFATVTYDMRADAATIPVTQTSVVTNEMTAAYDRGLGLLTLGALEPVTVNGLPAAPVIEGIPGGPGAGDGGGHILYQGDMRLGLKKFISLDGEHYVEAGEAAKAMALPENAPSTLYVKVVITNRNEFSAADINFRHEFKTGLSDTTAEGFQILEGATYDRKFKTIQVDKVKAGKTHEFVYAVMLRESGQNDAVAEDRLTVVHYGSLLPAVNDGLTYASIGEVLTSYLVAGLPAPLPTDVAAEEAATGRSRARTPLTADEAGVPVPTTYAPALEAGRPYELARTGAGTLASVLLMIAAAYFGWKIFERQRYQLLRRAALQPL